MNKINLGFLHFAALGHKMEKEQENEERSRSIDRIDNINGKKIF